MRLSVRVLVMLGAFVSILGLAACGGDDTRKSAERSQQSAEATDAFPDPADLIVQLDDLPGGYIAIIEDTGSRPLGKVLDRADLTTHDREVLNSEWLASYDVGTLWGHFCGSPEMSNRDIRLFAGTS